MARKCRRYRHSASIFSAPSPVNNIKTDPKVIILNCTTYFDQNYKERKLVTHCRLVAGENSFQKVECVCIVLITESPELLMARGAPKNFFLFSSKLAMPLLPFVCRLFRTTVLKILLISSRSTWSPSLVACVLTAKRPSRWWLMDRT